MTSRPAAPADVRMHGFARRSEVGDALAWVDATARPLPAEPVAVEDSAGRVLATELIAPIDVPAFQRSAMDGFALRGADTNGAGEYNPIEFPVQGQAMPGRPFEATVPASTAVRIMTGAPLPDGLDAVIPAEYATEQQGRIAVTRPVAPWQHVGRVGEDIQAGASVLPAGRRLRPQDGGVAASLGFAALSVHRRPRVRLLVTGNEVVAPGTPKGPWDIYDANSVTLRGLIARDGALLESHQRLGDDPAVITAALAAPGADVVLVSGGSSVGSEDHAPQLLARLGELAIHGIAMRPSSPAGMGRIGDTLVFLLPGNPVSCLCAYDFFAGRAIRRLGGLSAAWPYRPRRARVARKIVSAVGRVDYVRVRLDGDALEPLALSGASALSSTTRADGFVVVPAESEGYAPGTELNVFLYD